MKQTIPSHQQHKEEYLHFKVEQIILLVNAILVIAITLLKPLQAPIFNNTFYHKIVIKND